jgi:hypothetical protein
MELTALNILRLTKNSGYFDLQEVHLNESLRDTVLIE